MKLTKSQNNVVIKLFNAYLKKEEYKFATFKAPTGAGKTFMASEFISSVFANEISSTMKTIFIVATISNANLPKEFAKKLNKYKKFHEFNKYTIEYIQSPSSAKSLRIEDIYDFTLEDNKVFVFGTSSFGKNTLFFQNKTLDSFLLNAKNQKYQIFFIRDEAHIGAKERIGKNELKSFDEKMENASLFIVKMTATPRERFNLIEMTLEDMVEDDCFLIKEKMKKTKLSIETSNEGIINDAITTFIDVKKEYSSLKNVVIKPAMLIQIMNENDYKRDPIKNQQFHNELALLEKKLNKAGMIYLNISEVIGGKFPNTLEFASQIDSPIDVILFKVGPATGWDIPRACMLLQLRNVSSENLNVQTLGRIMRNPYPNLVKHNITNKYYVWSNYQKPTRGRAFYQIKENFKSKNFFAGYIDKTNSLIKSDQEKYKFKVLEFLDSSEFINKVKDLNPLKDIIYDSMNYGSAIVKNFIPNFVYLKIYNFKKSQEFEKQLFISLFQKKLQEIATSRKINIEIIKYVFLSIASKLIKIKHKNTTWLKNKEPYRLNTKARTREFYDVWIDNNDPKKVNTSDFKNYCYFQIIGDKDIQYLDSTPELKFYKKFNEMISTSQRKNIKLFTKMPSLGSKVYFEYYSLLKGIIAKSFMDFAIEYKGKIIMVEVKSFDNDYDEDKTKELLKTYKIYMEKFKDKKLYLVLYQYKKSLDNHNLHMMKDGKWHNDISFRDAFDYLLS